VTCGGRCAYHRQRKRRDVTESVCPLSVRVSLPVAASHTRGPCYPRRLSGLYRASGEKATPKNTASACGEHECLLAGGSVPRLWRSLSAPPVAMRFAIGRERDGPDVVRMSPECECLFACSAIPDSGGVGRYFLSGCAYHRERNATAVTPVAFPTKRERLFASGSIPEPGGVVRHCR